MSPWPIDTLLSPGESPKYLITGCYKLQHLLDHICDILTHRPYICDIWGQCVDLLPSSSATPYLCLFDIIMCNGQLSLLHLSLFTFSPATDVVALCVCEFLKLNVKVVNIWIKIPGG